MSRHLQAHEVFALFLPIGAIGTLAHEVGHLTPVWVAGLDWHLGYGYMTYGEGSDVSTNFALLVTAAGPLSTAAVGTLGWDWLRRRRRRVNESTPLGCAGWSALILALFWGRQVVNAASLLLSDLVAALWGTHNGAFKRMADELVLAQSWGLPERSISYASALVGLVFCADASLRLCPTGQRRALWLGAVPGGLVGIAVWLHWLGPWLMP